MGCKWYSMPFEAVVFRSENRVRLETARRYKSSFKGHTEMAIAAAFEGGVHYIAEVLLRGRYCSLSTIMHTISIKCDTGTFDYHQ